MATHATLFSVGQSLQIVHEGDAFQFNIQHATLDEEAKQVRGFSQHSHEVYHIVLFTGGETECAFDGRRLPVKRGSLVLTSPNIPHSFNVFEPRDCVYHELTFSMEHPEKGELLLPFHQLLAAYSGLNLSPKTVPLNLSEDTTIALERQFTRILDVLEVKSPLAHLDLALAVGRLLCDLIRIGFIDHKPGPKDTATRLLDVKQHIELNYADSESIDELAELACLSRGYFLREFKKLVGVSPNTYRIQLRIHAAQALLRTSNLQCREIALRTGFSDEYHFSRTFKQNSGLSPTEFRCNA